MATSSTKVGKGDDGAGALDEHEDAGHDDHGIRNGLGWGRGIVSDVKSTLLTNWKGEMTNLNGKVRVPARPLGCSMGTFVFAQTLLFYSRSVVSSFMPYRLLLPASSSTSHALPRQW